jgi:chlorite dismutase
LPEQTAHILNHFALYSFTETYWQLSLEERRDFHQGWLAGLRQAAQQIHLYQIFPAEAGSDILVWTAATIEASCDTARLFEGYARATNPYRRFIQPAEMLWGYTRPSEYTKTRSSREIDPFSQTRKPYLVVYPFVKTVSWYLMSREARQGMMNEHIRIGKQYAEIDQLLLYSFGVQDQEFVVVYELEELALFSQLVQELRSAEGRRYTERDTPLHAAIYHSAEETLALF